MPDFAWNETDVLTCPGLLPTEDEHGTRYVHQIERCGLRPDLTIEPYPGDTNLTHFQVGAVIPILEMKLLVCSGPGYVNDKRGEYLEFTPAKAFGSRYDGVSVIPYGVRLSVERSISIRLFHTSSGRDLRVFEGLEPEGHR